LTRDPLSFVERLRGSQLKAGMTGFFIVFNMTIPTPFLVYKISNMLFSESIDFFSEINQDVRAIMARGKMM